MSEQTAVADSSDYLSSRILWAACGTLVLAAMILAGLFVARAPGFTSLQTASVMAATPGGVHKMSLTIVTDAGPQKNWPAFEPSSFSLPAGQLVTISVTNRDGATALPAALGAHAKVTGVVGGVEKVVPIEAVHPYAAKSESRSMTAINLSVVSHTFSIPSLGINVPIAANTRTTFEIRIAKAGNYSWLCFDPCGTGLIGYGAPMGRAGLMAGTVTATAA